MRKNIFLGNEREFIALSAEGRPGGTVAEETRDLFQRFDEELRGLSLSLENTVRIRIFGRDKEARNLATAERSKILTTRTKTSSSSYICPEHFDSNAKVALDLIALRPANPSFERKLVEFDPPRNYLCYLIYDSFLFLSGVTSAGTNLDEQLAEILAEIEGSLTDGGSSWDRATGASFYLHRSQKVDLLRGLLEKKGREGIGQMDFSFVDGYAPEGRLLEVEVTARIDK